MFLHKFKHIFNDAQSYFTEKVNYFHLFPPISVYSALMASLELTPSNCIRV